MNDDLQRRREVLRSTLQLAVPLWIDRVKAMPWSQRFLRACVCADAIASQGDVIMFRSGKKGETAEAFNRLAEGVAILSFATGGVKIFGDRYETEDPAPKTLQHLSLTKVLRELADEVEKA